MNNLHNYIITHWTGIPRKFIRHADGTLATDRIDEMHDCGINLICSYDYGYETNCEILAYCQKIGMKVLQMDDRICQAVYDEGNREELLKAAVADYSTYPALFSYFITDEPNSKSFEAIKKTCSLLSELDPYHEAYVNLFPNYASTDQLGNSSYSEHIESFVSTVCPTILSYDHYHLMKGNLPENTVIPEDSREARIVEDAFKTVDRGGFFDNLEDVRASSLKHSIPFMLIVLMVEHGPYRNLTESEIRFEVFQALAYGSSRINYFTYWTPGVDTSEGDEIWHWKNAIINKDGTRNAHYEMVRRVNRDLQSLGTVLLNHKSIGVYHIGASVDRKVAYWKGSFGGISNFTGLAFTVGFFDAGYMLIANKNYEKSDIISFQSEKDILHFDKSSGLWKNISYQKNSISLTVSAGDAELFRILG